MIYSIHGTLSSLLADSIIVDVQGLGYQIYISDLAKTQLPSEGSPVMVYTYFHVREDQQTLFGFLNPQDKHLFMNLISVSGVGPKVGLKILSTLATTDIIAAIMGGNIPVLTSVSGVGKKMAERLILELRDALSKQFDFVPLSATQVSFSQSTPLEKDLSLALKTLGYSNEEIKRAIGHCASQLSTGSSLEMGIKLALKYL